MATERFTLMNIGDMNLEKRDVDTGESIPQGNTGMGQPARIDHDGIDFVLSCLMDTVNQVAS